VSFRLLDVDAFRARFMRLVLKMTAGVAVLAAAGLVVYEFIPEQQSVLLDLSLLAAAGFGGLFAAGAIAAISSDVRLQASSLWQRVVAYRQRA
jgi:hypothetical protein